MGPLKLAPFPNSVPVRIMAMKEYTTYHRDLELKPHLQIQLNVISSILVEVLFFFKGYSSLCCVDKGYIYIYIYIYISIGVLIDTSISDQSITSIFTNPFDRAGYDTKSISKWSLTGLNSEFSFSLTSCLLTKAEEPRIIGFPRVLVLCEMRSVSSRFLTHFAVSISYDDNH